MMALMHSQLHLNYSDVMEYPSLEFRGMTRQFLKLKKKEHAAMQPKAATPSNELDCDVVDANDYTKWFK